MTTKNIVITLFLLINVISSQNSTNINCPSGLCLSASGYCGNSPWHCNVKLGCVAYCTEDTYISQANEPCGLQNGYGNFTCSTNLCCSQYGYCGSSVDYCGTGCLFGACITTNQITTSMVIPTTTNMAISTTTNIVIRTTTNMAIPTTTNMVIPSTTNMVIPTTTNMAIPTTTNMAIPTTTTTKMVIPTTTNIIPIPTTTNIIPIPTTTNMAIPTTTNMTIPTRTNMAILTTTNMAISTTTNMAILTTTNMAILITTNIIPISTTTNMVIPTTTNMAIPTTTNMVFPTTTSSVYVSKPTNLVVGDGESCGNMNNGAICSKGYCCSGYGYCGNSTWHCASGLNCQNSCSPTCTIPASGASSKNISFGVEIAACLDKGSYGLSFDDGPSWLTGSVLDILDKFNVKATFFVEGIKLFSNQNGTNNYANSTLDAYNRGHQIASHSWDHKSNLNLNTIERAAELDATSCMIQSVIGKIPMYYRAPYGETDSAFLADLVKRNMKIIYWNIDAEDWNLWQTGKTANDLVSVYSKLLASQPASLPPLISLNHDRFDITFQALPRILQMIKDKGYKIQRIADCMYDTNLYF